MVIMVPDRVMAGLYAMHRPVFLLYPLVVSESETNFLKLRESELRRIHLPRTPVNMAKKSTSAESASIVKLATSKGED